MKYICIVTLVLVTATAADYYTSDRVVDFNQVIGDMKVLRKVVECLIGKVECTPEEAAVKSELPDALNSACVKCTDKQKHYTKLFIEAFKKNLPAEFENLKKNLDPENKLIPAIEAAVASY